MRRTLTIVLLLVACSGGWASATRVVLTPHVSVLYDDPSLADYAQQVAATAEREITQVAAVFGRTPFPIRVRLQPGDDVFNAFALPLPRPHVTFRPLFALSGALGFHAPDTTALVLRHEITHLVQLTDTRLPPGTAARPDIGLVGEGTAVLPPAWLLEGIAAYVESSPGPGGRLHDARTRGLLWTLAAAGDMPSLTDVSLITLQRWPGGRARYLLGSSFIASLVERHGFGALVSALHVFQAGAYLVPFSDAWKAAVGTDLATEWASWRTQLADAARARTDLAVPAGLEAAASRVGAPAIAPDGRTLAWPVSGGVRLATVADGTLEGARTVSVGPAAESLTWLDDRTVVLSAVARSVGAYASELFALDVASGRLERLTHGAHAHLPAADGHGCLLYVRDVVPDGASLRRWCPGGTDTGVWTAPTGAHIVGLAVSPSGRVAFSLFRRGRVDLALLGSSGPRYLTDDAASELDPSWQGDDRLWFASDASGLFQLYRSHVPVAAGPLGPLTTGPLTTGPLTTGPVTTGPVTTGPVTTALGGAEDAVATAGGVIYRTLHGDGYVLARLPDGAAAAAPRPPASAVKSAVTSTASSSAAGSAPAAATASAATTSVATTPVATAAAGSAPAAAAQMAASAPYPDEPYSPWPSVLPYGWLPTNGRLSLAPFGAGLELTAMGLDDSAHYALDLTAGYDTALRGALAGAYGYLRFGWNMPDPARAPGPPAVLGFGVRVGLWPHGAYLAPVDETAYGVRVETLVQVPVGPYAAALDLRGSLLGAPSFGGARPEAGVDAVFDGRAVDVFGAVTQGSALALRGRLSYGAAGPSAGAWAEAGWWPALGGGITGHVGVSAGYRPLPPVPVALPELAAVASLGARLPVPVHARLGDGLAALERIDIEPSGRLWAGTQPTSGGWTSTVGAGADVGLWADAVLDYDAALRFGVRAGYAAGWWLGFGLGLPF